MNWIWFETAKNGSVNGALIALLAVSFSLVYRTTRVFHLAIAAQILAGGFVAVLVSHIIHSFAASILAGIISATVLSLFYMQVYNHLQRREVSNSLRMISSIGLYFMAAGIAAVCFSSQIKRGVVSFSSSFQFGPFVYSTTDVRYIMALIMVIFAFIILFRSPLGKSIAAICSNRRLYAVLGRNEKHVKVVVFIVSGALSGLCAGFEALRNGVEPFGYLPLAMYAAAAALLGGRSLFFGPILAGLLFGFLKSVTTQVLSDAWVDTVVFGVLLIAVCFWPRFVLAPSSEEDRP